MRSVRRLEGQRAGGRIANKISFGACDFLSACSIASGIKGLLRRANYGVF
ncbi:MAG: hypothetical protein HC827_07625 [Cyanobacteria bacterium RM1_2_2]|nr:hypothetical protein [Cyanobacteria bacterium RM1_2_2]